MAPAAARRAGAPAQAPLGEARAGRLAGYAAGGRGAPLVWVLSDLAITGDPLWSLTNTRHTAARWPRSRASATCPSTSRGGSARSCARRCSLGAALGGVLSLLWLRRRALAGRRGGVLAVLVFAAFAVAGLPINTRYAFLAAAILCVFCGAGVFGWTRLERGDPRRRWWMAGGALVLVALIAYAPSQYRSAHRELDKLARQQSIEDDLLALVDDHAITLRCGPVGVPNHAPDPAAGAVSEDEPANVISAQVSAISSGVYVDPASKEVEPDYVLDPRDPHVGR